MQATSDAPRRLRWSQRARLLWLVAGLLYLAFFVNALITYSREETHGAVGINLASDSTGSLIISEVQPGMPAQRAGMRVGMRLLAIDGQTAPHDLSLGQALARLHGDVGTRVTLTLAVAGEVRNYTIQRVIAQPVLIALVPYGISARLILAYLIGLDIGIWLAFTLASGLLAWRRPDDLLAMFTSITLLTLGATLTGTFYRLVGMADWQGWAADALLAISLACGYILLFLFPDGHFVPSWSRYLALLHLVWALVQIIFPGANPVVWRSLLSVGLNLGLLGIGLATQIYRYRYVSTPVQRQQTKWVILGVAGMMAGYLLVTAWSHLVPPPVEPFARYALLDLMVFTPAFNLSRILLAAAITASMLRYRLWDVDIIIRRTLIYTLLTGVLAAIYLLSLAVFQTLIRGTSARSSEIVVLLSTLAIAALFTPLRGRIQEGIDRRFYRRKYDAARTLARFAATVRDDVELTHLSAHLLSVVQETMQPGHVSLWLAPTVLNAGDDESPALAPGTNTPPTTG